jgi:hypothetical protein
MSALGQKRIFANASPSTLLPKADIVVRAAMSAFVPIRDIRWLFDYLVGAGSP